MKKATEIIARESIKNLFKDGQEAQETVDGIKRILDDFVVRRDPNETTRDVIEFLEKIWRHFSIGEYTKIFVDFAGAEKALYGLGETYRDHLIHVFNVFFMGIVVFLEALEEDKGVFRLLKIREESEKVPFPTRYNKWRRLYYLWCLTSTFHDIAIPVDHIKEIDEGLNRLLSYFGIETERLSLEFPFMIQSDVSRYSNLEAKLFAQGVVMSESQELPTYELSETHTASSLYFRSVLNAAMDKRDHGVLGAYFLFKSIQEMFLSGKNPSFRYDLDLSALIDNRKVVDLPHNRLEWGAILQKRNLSEEELNNLPRMYDLGRGETKSYNDYVFEQDVTRAALAIALHSLDPNSYPKIFPIRFSKLPVSFLLILFDELQEFYRPEGFVLTEIVRFHEFPQIDVKVKHLAENQNHIQITMVFNLEKLSRVEEKQVVSKYNEWAEKKQEVHTYEELVWSSWTNIFETIQRKLSFREKEPLEIYVKVKVEGKDPNGRALEFRSPNWTHHPEANIKLGYYP